ncbi:MAG: 5-deoxy-glucuronate isomerase, partial [Ilumatobacteraceae bacterium]
MTPSLHRPVGALAVEDLSVSLTPDDAGWTYAGLRVVCLAPGVERSISLGDNEGVVLPLSATDVDVAIDGEHFTLDGRVSVFDRVTDFAYAPLGATVVLKSAAGGEVAIPTSRCEQRLKAAYGSA